MRYLLDERNNREKITVKCDMCEDCDICNTYYLSRLEYHEGLVSCSECDVCNKLGHCDKIIWEGTIASSFLDFMSLDFVKIANDINAIINSYSFLESEEQNKYDMLQAKIESFLISQHFYFQCQGISRNIVKKFVCYSKIKSSKVDNDDEYLNTYAAYNTFCDYLIGELFNPYLCTQKILEEYFNNPQFHNNPKVILAIFDLGIMYSIQDWREHMIDFERYEMDRNVRRNNVISTIKDYITQNTDDYNSPGTYIIKDIKELNTLAFTYIYGKDLLIKKCENCGKYFIPLNRSDEKYCDRTSPQDSKKTCKEYGAQKAWIEKIKNNEAIGLYRKIYMSKQMLAKRNPDICEYKTSFEKYKEQSSQWKADVKSGIKTEQEFIEWLKQVKEKKVL